MIVDLVGDLFTNRCQVEKLLLDERVFCLFGKLSIFGRLVSKIVRVVHAVSRLFDWPEFASYPSRNQCICAKVLYGLITLVRSAVEMERYSRGSERPRSTLRRARARY